MSDEPGPEVARITIVRYLAPDGDLIDCLDREGDAETVTAAVAMLAMARDTVLHPEEQP